MTFSLLTPKDAPATVEPVELAAECPRCPAEVVQDSRTWRCADHGEIAPLWRTSSASYDAFAQHLQKSRPLPTWLPWPLPGGWSVTDFGSVCTPGQRARATFVGATGMTDADGVVEVAVVSEEPGVGLGARCAGVVHTDPGAEVTGAPVLRVQVDGHSIPLWAVSTSQSDADFDRSVFAGEAHGRWLWLVLRPASAALLLQAEWAMTDVAALGPELVDLAFSDAPRAW